MKWLATGVAAIALVAGPVAAQGNGKGNGNGNGGGNAAAKADRGGGQDKARGNGNGNRGNAMRGNQGNQGNGNAKANRGNGGGNARADRGPDIRAANRGNGNGNGNANRAVVRDNGNGNGNRNQGNGNRTVRYDDGFDRRDDRRYDRRDGDRYVDYRRADYGLIDGCPPGLAKKNNGCQPPGQAKQNNDYYRGDWWGYDRYRNDRFTYRDGYLLRFGNGGNLLSYLPLLGGALSPGNVWPSYYSPVAVPSYYDDYYDLGGPRSYRYADNVLYRVDPETAAITSIAALLTGDDFTVGQPMPRGYDVYNVPYSYRDRYYDTPQSNYRYSDGYIYQVDPETRLVAAAIELIAS